MLVLSAALRRYDRLTVGSVFAVVLISRAADALQLLAQSCSGLTCANGRCVNGLDVCNGRDDCGDNSDEWNCRASDLLRYCQNPGKEDWIWNGGAFCYGIFNVPSPFDMAQRQCQSKGSQLASIHSTAESQFLVQAIAGIRSLQNRFSYHAYTYWIGLQQVDTDTYEWADGTPLNYENWSAGEPSSPLETCVEIYGLTNGKWNDERCYRNKAYVCKALALPNATATKENCGKPVWLSFNESRYILVDNQDDTWYNAEEICYGYDAQLAVITSQEELQWITEVLLFKQRGDYTAWIRNSSVTYNESRVEDPLEYSQVLMAAHDCQAIVKDRKSKLFGSVKAINCFRRNGFICKDHLTNDLPKNASCVFPFIYNGEAVSGCIDDSSAGTSWCSLTKNYDIDRQSRPCDLYKCPPGWQSFGGNCYHIPQQRGAWAEGGTSCEYASGSLAPVTEPRTLSVVSNMVARLNLTVVWVGSESKRTEEATVMTTGAQGQVLTINITGEYGDYDASGLAAAQDCRAIFIASPGGSPPKLLQVVNCSQAWNFVCIKKASYARDERLAVHGARFSEEGFSPETVHAVAGVGALFVLLLLLTWPAYGLVRWRRNRDSSQGPELSFSYLKSIGKSHSYNPLAE